MTDTFVLEQDSTRINYQILQIEIYIDDTWHEITSSWKKIAYHNTDTGGCTLKPLELMETLGDHVSPFFTVDNDMKCEWINLVMLEYYSGSYRIELVDDRYTMVFSPPESETMFWLRHG